MLRLCRQVPKRISAAAFSADGEHAIFADKFGDVHVARTAAPAAAADSAALPPTRLNHGVPVVAGKSLWLPRSDDAGSTAPRVPIEHSALCVMNMM